MSAFTDKLYAEADERAYIAACERVGPNSPEFEDLYDRLYDTFCEPINRYGALRQASYSHHDALLKAGLRDPY